MSLSFKQLRINLQEAKKGSIPKDEKKVKEFTVGKSKTPAVITKRGSKFAVYIGGDELDLFKNANEAEKAAKDFAKLMDN
jgi:hypothetical protein